MLSCTMQDTFEKSVILGNKCDSSSIMHLKSILRHMQRHGFRSCM